MSLKHVKAVHDLGTHFVVEPHPGKGKPYPVAKKGLSKRMLTHIQAMCTGGQVQHFDAGGVAVDTTPAQQQYLDSQPDSLVNKMKMADINDARHQDSYQQQYEAMRHPPGQDFDTPERDQATSNAQQLATPVDANNEPMGPPAPPPDVNPSPDPQSQAPDYQPPQFLAAPPGSQAQPPAPQFKMPQMPSGAAIYKDFDNQAAAVQRAADVQAKQSDEDKRVYDEYQSQSAARTKAFNDSMAAQKADYEVRQKNINDTSIDPSGRRSTPTNILSAFGLILSGAGSAMSRQPNMAYDIINKQIDRDIDAQKTDLGKQENQLSRNLQQTGNLREAEQMTRAQMLTDRDAQLKGAAAKFGGEAGKANADLMSARLLQQRDQLAYQISAQRAQMAGQQAQQQQYANSLNRLNRGEGSIEDEMIMPKDVTEAVVGLPDGRRALAHSKEAAEAFRKSQAEIAPLQGHLRRLNGMGEGLRLGQNNRQEFESERDATIAELGHLAGLSRFTPEEAKIFEKRIRNLNDPIQGRNGYDAGLRGIQSEIDDKAYGDSNTYLRRSRIAAPPSRVQ